MSKLSEMEALKFAEDFGIVYAGFNSGEGRSIIVSDGVLRTMVRKGILVEVPPADRDPNRGYAAKPPDVPVPFMLAEKLAYAKRIKERIEKLLKVALLRSEGYHLPMLVQRPDWEPEKPGGTLTVIRSYQHGFSDGEKQYQIHGLPCEDALFIAACAGAAEAGWRSTLAAIENIETSLRCCCGLSSDIEASLDKINAEWPEKLLEPTTYIIPTNRIPK
jgi:hypothetical protein